MFGWRVVNGQIEPGCAVGQPGSAYEYGDEVAVARKRSRMQRLDGSEVSGCIAVLGATFAMACAAGGGDCLRLCRRSAWRPSKSSADEWEAGCARVSSRREEWVLPVYAV